VGLSAKKLDLDLMIDSRVHNVWVPMLLDELLNATSLSATRCQSDVMARPILRESMSPLAWPRSWVVESSSRGIVSESPTYGEATPVLSSEIIYRSHQLHPLS